MKISKRFIYRNILQCIFTYKIKMNAVLPEMLCVVVRLAENSGGFCVGRLPERKIAKIRRSQLQERQHTTFACSISAACNTNFSHIELIFSLKL